MSATPENAACPAGDGVWVARYSDRSAIAAFPSELDALRHAVKWSMEVAFMRFGFDLFTGEDRRD